MALIGRSPVRLAATTSSAPYESMVASLQSHIDQLVQKNKTYEHTIQKLQAAIEDEKERSAETANRLRATAAQERETWREGCDSLLASHRIVHLRTNMELEKTRSLMLKEKEENRRERLSVLQRDYKLALFQARELELESKILELEDLLEEMAEQNEQDAVGYVKQHDEEVEALKAGLKKSENAKEDALATLNEVEDDKRRIEKELAVLRQEHTALVASSASTTTKLERVSLQLEGALSSKAELENTNNELKRNNVDLKRQLDKWQNLETKGGAEIEEMRKRRMELEVKVKGLEVRVKELEKSEKESAKALEKEKKKVEKRQAEIDKLQELTEEAQEIATRAQAEEARLNVELEKLQKELQKTLASQRSKPAEKPRPVRKETTPEREVESTEPDRDPGQTPASEREVEDVITPKPVKTRGRAAPKSSHHSEGSDNDEPAPRTVNKGKGKAKVATESDTEEPSDGGKKRKNAVATSFKNTAKSRRKADWTDEDGVSEVDVATAKPDKKGKGRTVTNHPAGTRKGKTGQSTTSSATATRKAKAGRNEKEDKEDKSEEDIQPKKKKKLFPQAQPMSFAWDSFPKVDDGLGIPTELSPVKATDAVPARSIFGRVGSALSWRK